LPVVEEKKFKQINSKNKKLDKNKKRKLKDKENKGSNIDLEG
jgi:hypothetical protein